MSDYLGRLVDNSAAQEASIRPRQPQPFERWPLAAALPPPAPEEEVQVDADTPAPAAASPVRQGVRVVREPVLAQPVPANSMPMPRPVAPRRAGPIPVPAPLRPNRPGPERGQDRSASVLGASTSEETPPAPTIHVTIGRVEVRAVQPPVPPAAEVRSERNSHPTLDEYLKSRAGSQP